MARANWNQIYEDCLARLLYPDSFRSAGPARVLLTKNGVGPEKWPAWLRWALERILPSMVKPSIIHDWEFDSEENDGSVERWHESNSRWLENVKREVRKDYAFWRFIERARSFAGAELGFRFLETEVGFDAWKAAHERRKARTQSRGDIEEIRDVLGLRGE